VADILVVQSKIRDMIKAEGCSTSSGAIEALSDEVSRLVKRAIERTKGNGRKTVKGNDI
jgi:histone H3/H4